MPLASEVIFRNGCPGESVTAIASGGRTRIAKMLWRAGRDDVHAEHAPPVEGDGVPHDDGGRAGGRGLGTVAPAGVAVALPQPAKGLAGRNAAVAAGDQCVDNEIAGGTRHR